MGPWLAQIRRRVYLGPLWYDDTVNDVVPVPAGRAVSLLVEDDKDLDLGDMLLSRNSEVRASLCVDFTAIQT